MKPASLNLLALLLIAAAPCVVLAMDERACHDGYSTMLLTRNECMGWVGTRNSLEKRGQLNEVKQLDEKMRALMAERAEACPCSWDRAFKQKKPNRNAGL